MELTYILVDFENVQPSAQDITRVRGEQYRLLIFHGPQQKRFDADVVQAWQPLGDKVQFIQCPKSGRNALDMHIAFHIGLIVEGHTKAGAAAPKSFRLIVISNDTDFDPLLQYLRESKYAANRSATIRAAIGVGAAAAPGASESEKVGGRAAKAKAVVIPQPAAKKAARTKTATAAKQAGGAKKVEARKAEERKVAAKKAQRKEPPPSPAKPPAPDRLDKLIEHLHSHPKGRPSKRKALEKHIASVLRGKVEAAAVPDLIGELERRGLVGISGTKVDYPLWSEEE